MENSSKNEQIKNLDKSTPKLTLIKFKCKDFKSFSKFHKGIPGKPTRALTGLSTNILKPSFSKLKKKLADTPCEFINEEIYSCGNKVDILDYGIYPDSNLSTSNCNDDNCEKIVNKTKKHTKLKMSLSSRISTRREFTNSPMHKFKKALNVQRKLMKALEE